jgi:uncharacterized protein YhbP (UPF0306 family)
MEPTNLELTQDIIANNLYMVLATALNDEPWAAPFFFTIDEDYNFYFVSGKETRHAAHIQKNPRVAIAIFDSREVPEQADGFYVEGIAKMVELDDLQRVMDLVYLKRFPDPLERAQHIHPPEDFFGNNPRRFYQIVPTHIYKLERAKASGVDGRIEISLENLRNKSD